MNLQYIIPLKRDCNLIDYSKASVDYLDEGGEAFRYHGREIYMYRKDIDDNHSIDLCVDCSMRSAETNDFQNSYPRQSKQAGRISRRTLYLEKFQRETEDYGNDCLFDEQQIDDD